MKKHTSSQPVSEPVAESVTEPATNSVAESVTSPVTDAVKASSSIVTPSPVLDTRPEANPRGMGEKGKPYIDLSRRVLDVVMLVLAVVYTLVMLGSGFNFLPAFAAALAAVAAIIIFVRLIVGKGVSLFLYCAYAVLILGTFLFFLIWGADSFANKLGYNLLLILGPLFFGIFLFMLAKGFTPKHTSKKGVKVTAALSAFFMFGTAILYVFFMSFRLTPTVEDMSQGQDDYLASIKSQGTSEGSPNVLVVLMDDMAYSDISCYSYLGRADATIQTPALDSLADDGIYMDDFYAASPVCSPSRFSILTGRYSSRGYLDNVVFPTVVCGQADDAFDFSMDDPYCTSHFVNPFQFQHNVDGILGDEITIAEVLQAAGYDTSLIGKWNLGDYGEYLPTNQGFDYFYGSYYVNDMTPYNVVEEIDGKSNEVLDSVDERDQSLSTQRFTSKVIDSIASSTADGNKFFVEYATPWPHYPIFSDDNGNGVGDTTDDSYIQCIEEFDRYLGTVLDYLKSTADPRNAGHSLYDNTLIVFTSDNGPGREGVTGALRGRKNTTFDGGMKVPCIVTLGDSLACGTGGNMCLKEAAMNIDLFPTILEFCGITSLPADRIIDGVSLYSLWTSGATNSTLATRPLYYLKGGKLQSVSLPVSVDGTTSRYKYYRHVQSENSAFWNQSYNNYLFNLTADPAEGYNVSMTYPDVLSTLSAQFDAFKAEMKCNRRGIVR